MERLDMLPKDIVIGNYYRHITSPDYAWAKAVEILKPKRAPNTHNYIIVKCEWTVEKNQNIGLIKYFRPCDLIKTKPTSRA